MKSESLLDAGTKAAAEYASKCYADPSEKWEIADSAFYLGFEVGAKWALAKAADIAREDLAWLRKYADLAKGEQRMAYKLLVKITDLAGEMNSEG